MRSADPRDVLDQARAIDKLVEIERCRGSAACERVEDRLAVVQGHAHRDKYLKFEPATAVEVIRLAERVVGSSGLLVERVSQRNQRLVHLLQIENPASIPVELRKRRLHPLEEGVQLKKLLLAVRRGSVRVVHADERADQPAPARRSHEL